MKQRLLDLIKCPKCGRKLELLVLDEHLDQGFIEERESLFGFFPEVNLGIDKWSYLYRNEIVSGILHCSCNSFYPVINGVPRLLSEPIKEFPEFFIENRTIIENMVQKLNDRKTKSYHTRSKVSFEMQWNEYNYDETTWGKELDVRKLEFLENFRITEDELKGKLIFDAGCGNGRLTGGLAPFGCEIVGMDYTKSVARANAKKGKFAGRFSPFVHFVQGDLARTPICDESFDFIHSSGVIHHTPEPIEAFRQFVKTGKKDSRVYILMYRKRTDLIGYLNKLQRFLTTKLPKKALFKLCLFFAPVHQQISQNLARRRGEKPTSKLKNSELAIVMFDNLSPTFQYRYDLFELINMFENEGIRFEGEVTHETFGEERHCIGILGTKIS